MRSDCTFLFLTKRIERFAQCIPEDWADGYENVIVCCTIENQRNADKKLSVFQALPIKHKCITAQPLIERVNLEPYLDGVELVVVGGESDRDARPLDYDWVLDIREQCIRKQVNFEFRQCGTHFIKDGGSISSRPETCAGRLVWPVSTATVRRAGIWNGSHLMHDTLTVNDAEYAVIKLLGKGKGGYSYLVTDGEREYVLKQIHHEPCEYYTFGDKLQSELRDYKTLRTPFEGIHPRSDGRGAACGGADGRVLDGAGARYVRSFIPSGAEHRLLPHQLCPLR